MLRWKEGMCISKPNFLFWCSKNSQVSPNLPLWFYLVLHSLPCGTKQDHLPFPKISLQTLTSVCMQVIPSQLLFSNSANSCNPVHSLSHNLYFFETPRYRFAAELIKHNVRALHLHRPLTRSPEETGQHDHMIIWFYELYVSLIV